MRRLLLIGNGTLACRACEGLLDGGLHPVAAMTRPASDRVQRAADPLHRTLFRVLAKARIPRLDRIEPDRPAFRDLLARQAIDCVLMAGWGDILPAALLASTGIDFLNCHPSLLPAHRGANPYAAAIRAGDTTTGVTVHRVDAQVDTGPVLLREALPVLPDDTGATLRARAGETVRRVMTGLAALLAAGPLPAGTPQDEFGPASRHRRMHVDEAWLDFRWPAERLEREVRALQPWLVPQARLAGRGGWRLQLRRCEVVAAPEGAVALAPGVLCSTPGCWPTIRCGDGERVLHALDFGIALGERALPAQVARRLARRLLAAGRHLLAPAERH